MNRDFTKRLQAGMVTVAELAAETVRPWKHLGLKQRTMGIAGRAGGFHFADRLHIIGPALFYIYFGILRRYGF